MRKSELEEIFLYQIKAFSLPKPIREYKFHPKRKWRFDFAWTDQKIAVEIQGGTWKGGRHTRASGYRNDREKMNEATLLNWKVFEFTSDMVKKGEGIILLEKALKYMTND